MRRFGQRGTRGRLDANYRTDFLNGLTPTLRGVLETYNAGMPRPPMNAQGLAAIPPSPLIQPLQLTAKELQDLEAFHTK